MSQTPIGSLPRKPQAVILHGRRVRLEPYSPVLHAGRLFEISSGAPFRLGEKQIGAYDPEESIWKWMPRGPFGSVSEFRATFDAMAALPDQLPFTVFDLETGEPIGMSSLMSNAPEHLKIEVGNIWYCSAAQASLANTEAVYLLLSHAFGLGYRRLEWKCDFQNLRSRRAALRIGFRYEGVQEGHMIVKGRNRDTAWFRILAAEWPEVKKGLERMLA